MTFDFPTPDGGKPSRPDPEPTFGDEMGESELQSAIVDYQKWCSENYPLEIDLDGIPVEVSNKLKRTAGKVAHIKGSDRVKHIRYAMKSYQKWGWEQFTETIRHELIHVHTVQNHQKGGHGRLFKSMVDDLDTHRYCETFADDDAKYILYCKGCEQMVARRFQKSKTVKSPGKYRSKCCGSPLWVENA